jgi:hypothetical protein
MVKALFPELPRDGRRKKMGNLFDLGHVTQLHEIQRARLKRGKPGIGREVEELIRRLTSGGVAGESLEPWAFQAKRYFEMGIGREIGITHFEKYLETIPKPPPQLRLLDKNFPLLILVEPRLGLKMLCSCGNVDFDGDDDTFIRCDLVKPFWIRMQDGRKNRNRSVDDCRRDFAKNELGLTALEGVSAYIQYPEVVSDSTRRDGHAMDMPGSVRCEQRGDVASLRASSGRIVLDWRWGDSALPNHGSASCRKF